MDDFLLPPPSDEVDCLVEVHMLKEESKILADETLVEFVSEVGQDLDLTVETENAMAFFFNSGYLNRHNRSILENCYVLLKNFLCVSEDGEICKTLMVGS